MGGAASSKCIVLVVGLDASGKTSIMHKLGWGLVTEKIVTIGCSVDTLSPDCGGVRAFKGKGLGDFSMTALDLIHKEEILFRLRHALTEILDPMGACNGVVFVVDAHDNDRLDEEGATIRRTSSAKELFAAFLALQLNDRLVVPATAPVLVFANKQDLSGAVPVVDLIKRLDLASLGGRRWHVQGCSATTGDGLEDGMDWLLSELAKKAVLGK